jgi:hypothetical protein
MAQTHKRQMFSNSSNENPPAGAESFEASPLPPRLKNGLGAVLAPGVDELDAA